LDAIKLAAMIDEMPDKKAFDNLFAKVEGIDTKLATLGDNKIEKPEVAELNRIGSLDEMMSFKVWDIPLGQAVVGGFGAVFATELIDGFMATSEPWKKGLVKLVIAGASIKFGKKFLGEKLSQGVALLLAFDGTRDLLPIDTWAQSLANKITGSIPAAGLASHKVELEALRSNTGVSNAGTGRSSYYAAALGGH
jgi:hypothetical protein